MPYRVRQDMTVITPAGNVVVHAAGDVLGDDEVHPRLQERVHAGEPRCSSLLEALTHDQARGMGVRTKTRPKNPVPDGHVHANELRWSGVSPGDTEHIAELEERISALEAKVQSIRSTSPESP